MTTFNVCGAALSPSISITPSITQTPASPSVAELQYRIQIGTDLPTWQAYFSATRGSTLLVGLPIYANEPLTSTGVTVEVGDDLYLEFVAASSGVTSCTLAIFKNTVLSTPLYIDSDFDPGVLFSMSQTLQSSDLVGATSIIMQITGFAP
jgi:hypothetical protein